VSQIPEAIHKALAGLAVHSAGLQHGLALFHKLDDTNATVRFIPMTQNRTRADQRGATQVIPGVIKAMNQSEMEVIPVERDYFSIIYNLQLLLNTVWSSLNLIGDG